MNNFVLSFMILICSVRITVLDRFTPIDVDLMHYTPVRGHALITYTDDTELCYRAWNGDYRPEMNYVYMYCDPFYPLVENKPSLVNCTGFDCWESQLSMVSRVEISDIMNKYRYKVAKGTCKKWCEKNKNRLAFELRWNYFLEKNATGYLGKCMKSRFTEKVITEIKTEGGIRVPAFKELFVTSFKMKTGLQNELRSMLWRLMYKNVLKDWDKESQFRRGDMHEFACAFACRRNVNFYITDLNETVVNGTVGHLSCAFVTTLVNITQKFGGEVVSPINTAMTPSLPNCQKADPYLWFFGIYETYYPTLCRRNTGSHTADALITDMCNKGPHDVPSVCPGAKHSPITWEEKFYGLTFQFIQPFPNKTNLVNVEGQCNVPPPKLPEAEYDRNDLNYLCTLQEVVGVRANTELCSGWNCADSQLTDATRLQILDMLNGARNLIAKGECSEECPHPCKGCNANVQYCNMVHVQWHWFLERKASEIVKNCPTNNTIETISSYDDDPFPVNHEVIYEQIALLFDLPYYEGQLALPKTFLKLFWTNAFLDWTNFGYFRRANAMFIGCSIISRPYTEEVPKIEPEMNFYNGIPTHMVCIYASLNGSLISLLDEPEQSCCPSCPVESFVNTCWLYFTNRYEAYESLCHGVSLIMSTNCQVGDRCKDDTISKAWYIQYKGITVVQTINGSLLGINRYAFNSIGLVYERKYCWFIIFLLLLQTWLWIFLISLIYSHDNINIRELLKETFTRSVSKIISKMISKEKSPEIEPSSETLSEDAFDIEEAEPRQVHAEKSTEPKFEDVEPSGEIPSSKDRRDSDLDHSASSRAKQPMKKRTTPVPYRTPVAKKTRIREARSEDENLDDESEMEWITGPTVTIPVGVVASKKMFTGRPPRERKPPKRAKPPK